MKKMIIASTSTVYGSGYLEYILPELANFFKEVEEVLFIPYARPGGVTYDEYTDVASKAFVKIGKKIKGIHEFEDPKIAIQNAEAIFVGGGNTFVLVDTLYKYNLFSEIIKVVKNGTLYFGTSAGSNITGINMRTTNDMPIVYPPDFKTLGLIPFNLNPHYLDPNPNSKHKGETRETRIREFHGYNDIPVLGLREGSWLEVLDQEITLKGTLTARLFRKSENPIELEPGIINIDRPLH
ncbi:MAG: dipeptidase PepE [Flavobacteriaceae bacterium]|nr:dipeptidase PepE [Flavobacteriaceae bacterium]